jgi:hypothetical protein
MRKRLAHLSSYESGVSECDEVLYINEITMRTKIANSDYNNEQSAQRAAYYIKLSSFAKFSTVIYEEKSTLCSLLFTL